MLDRLFLSWRLRRRRLQAQRDWDDCARVIKMAEAALVELKGPPAPVVEARPATSVPGTVPFQRRVPLPPGPAPPGAAPATVAARPPSPLPKPVEIRPNLRRYQLAMRAYGDLQWHPMEQSFDLREDATRFVDQLHRVQSHVQVAVRDTQASGADAGWFPWRRGA